MLTTELAGDGLPKGDYRGAKREGREGAVSAPPLPWWRFKMVWLVWGLPATVVVASLVTGGIAWTHVDPIVTDARPSRAVAADEAAEHGQPATGALVPAMAARNHASLPDK